MEGRKGRRDRDGGYGNETKFKLKRKCDVLGSSKSTQVKSSGSYYDGLHCVSIMTGHDTLTSHVTYWTFMEQLSLTQEDFASLFRD